MTTMTTMTTMITPTTGIPSKYGMALTGSDWVGLPLRIGYLPESGIVTDLSSETDAVLVWSGGATDVEIDYRNPGMSDSECSRFKRQSGAIDLLPRGTRLDRVTWHGEPSICTSVNFPEACLSALSTERTAGLDPKPGAQFGLNDGHVVDLVRRLQAQAERKEDYGAVYIQSLSLALASYVSARYGAGSAPVTARRGLLSSAQRQAIEAFVERELGSNFGLVDLASLTGYCPDHFSRLFRQAFETSPHQYVLARRVERAKTMLRDCDRPISEIAVACGFANQGHLTTAFKRRLGVTPSAYRKA